MKKSIILLSIMIFIGSAAISCKPDKETYTVIVSLDAFRWDYLDEFSTSGLNEIASDGVQGILKPSYPASTFPNHYTIATGLVPDHHGIVNGSFWDPDTQTTFSMGDSLTRYNPEYYLGEPIWVTAEKAGLKTACIYWVGSDVEIKGILPTYSYPWWQKPHLSFKERANETVRLLSLPRSERPNLVMLYFDEPDGISHKYGPLASETKDMTHHLDSIVIKMYHQLRELEHGEKINVIIVSDHGMTEVSKERFIDMDDYIKPSWYKYAIGTNPTNIYTDEHLADSIINALADVEHINVWKHGQVPKELNYGTSDRCGDIIVAPDLGWQFSSVPNNIIGAHGYSPLEKDMHAIFIASGPSFENRTTCKNKQINNIDLYSILCDILLIKPAITDGKLPYFINEH